MNRRIFLAQASAAAACVAPNFLFAQTGSQPLEATLTIDESNTLATVPSDFIGLSYESAQLANPAFFAASNKALIALLRELSEDGVLRLGGGTSEFTCFTTKEKTGAPPFDAVGPDTSKNVKSDTPITPKSLENLREFLDAANWRCLYGLNAARGPVANAVEEAAYVQRILGPRLIAFQLGNEPDAWRRRYRPSTWSYADYWKEWSAMHAAIVARVPQAKFAGPDVSNKMDYVTGFAEDVKKSAQDVVLLTWHYYAMGPAGAKGITLDKLLSPDPKLTRALQIAQEASRTAGIPFRMTEGNSCWNGGQPGVSDTLASALWAADVMLQFAAAGSAGVNFHGGGNGYYTPIAGSVEAGFKRRPEFFGMELAKHLVGASMQHATLDCSDDRVSAYAGRKSGAQMVLAINKTNQHVEVRTPMRHAREEWHLTGRSIDAKQGITLSGGHATAFRRGVMHVEPYSAVMIRE
ncbi:MAG TPA: hypothetical protein VGR47_09795 [Terracidiphilus sp.]|nr:hypothetical protein [Terracidiphilus sp.]